MSGNNHNRRNWTRSLTIVMLVAVVGAVIGCMAKKEAPTTDRRYFRNTAGSVLFDHGQHSSSADSCAKCHHDLYSAAQATSCKECHGDDVDPSEFQHAELKEIHSRDCSKCHKESGKETKPLSCRECHPAAQPSETQTNKCSQCHDDSFTPDMMDHDDYLDIQDHTCLGCHTPQAVSQVYHTNCIHCHLETLPDRFTSKGGDVTCGACHLR